MQALEQQHQSLVSLTDQLRNKAGALTDMLERHQIARDKLKADLKAKKHAQDLDASCLQLQADTASQHPPQVNVCCGSYRRISRSALERTQVEWSWIEVIRIFLRMSTFCRFPS